MSKYYRLQRRKKKENEESQDIKHIPIKKRKKSPSISSAKFNSDPLPFLAYELKRKYGYKKESIPHKQEKANVSSSRNKASTLDSEIENEWIVNKVRLKEKKRERTYEDKEETFDNRKYNRSDTLHMQGKKSPTIRSFSLITNHSLKGNSKQLLKRKKYDNDKKAIDKKSSNKSSSDETEWIVNKVRSKEKKRERTKESYQEENCGSKYHRNRQEIVDFEDDEDFLLGVNHSLLTEKEHDIYSNRKISKETNDTKRKSENVPRKVIKKKKDSDFHRKNEDIEKIEDQKKNRYVEHKTSSENKEKKSEDTRTHSKYRKTTIDSPEADNYPDTMKEHYVRKNQNGETIEKKKKKKKYHSSEKSKNKKIGKAMRVAGKVVRTAGTVTGTVASKSYSGIKSVVSTVDDEVDNEDSNMRQLATQRAMSNAINSAIKIGSPVITFPVKKIVQGILFLLKLLTIKLVVLLVSLIAPIAPLLLIITVIVLLVVSILNAISGAIQMSPLANSYGFEKTEIEIYIREQVDEFWEETETIKNSSQANHTIYLINGIIQNPIDNYYDILASYVATYTDDTYVVDEDGKIDYGLTDILKDIFANNPVESNYADICMLTDENKRNVDEIINQMLSYINNYFVYTNPDGSEVSYRTIKIDVHSYECYADKKNLNEQRLTNGRYLLKLYSGYDDYEDVPKYVMTSNKVYALNQLIEAAETIELQNLILKLKNQMEIEVSYEDDFCLEDGYTKTSFIQKFILEQTNIETSNMSLENQLRELMQVDKASEYELEELHTGDVLYYRTGDENQSFITKAFIYVGAGYGFVADTYYRQVIFTTVPSENPYAVCHLLK